MPGSLPGRVSCFLVGLFILVLLGLFILRSCAVGLALARYGRDNRIEMRTLKRRGRSKELWKNIQIHSFEGDSV
jgi:hypothetical protein